MAKQIPNSKTDSRMEQLCKLKRNLIITETILLATEIEKIRVPNTIVIFIEGGEFCTSRDKANAMPKSINFKNLYLGPTQNYAKLIQNIQLITNIDRRQKILT